MSKIILSQSQYNDTLYSGLQGIIMKRAHVQLEKKINNKKKYNNVLEIGAGWHPHLNYIKHNYSLYHILETNKETKKIYENKKKVKHFTYDGKKLPFKDNYFDRIIICHCLEHINYPEEFLIKMMSKLKRGGKLSISLPADPGFLWRLGKFYVKHFIATNSTKMTKQEYSYFSAVEHVNSIFNLISIIRYKYKGKIEEQFLPLSLPIIDLNLIYNVTITK
tara:strand:- start:206 stop:865 length:660 start_codon:yes stop_codon:yes gene_type:complete